MWSACLQKVGRLENMIGWYHSHPGYGCWLSGIDVGTQATQQMYQEPFLAIVIDPHRTIAAGKVEIGAFRTYPEVNSCFRLLAPSLASTAQLACCACLCQPQQTLLFMHLLVCISLCCICQASPGRHMPQPTLIAPVSKHSI